MFGSVDWYDLDDGVLSSVTAIVSEMSSAHLITILRKSVIEPTDAQMAIMANNKGIEEEESGNKAKACEHYTYALSLDPHCFSVLFNIIDWITEEDPLRSNNIDKILNKILLLQPDNARVWGIKALRAEGLGLYDVTSECYATAYRIDKSSL